MVSVACQRGFFAEVDEGGVAVVGAEQQEAAAAEVAGDGMDDGQGKAGGHGGIDRVAAGAEDIEAGVGGQVMDGDDHAVRGADRLLGKIGKRVLRALLSGGEGGEGERGDREDGKTGEVMPSIHSVGQDSASAAERASRAGAG